MPEAAVLALMHKTAEKKKARKLAMDLRILFVLVIDYALLSLIYIFYFLLPKNSI